LIDLSAKTGHDADKSIVDQLQTMVDRFNELYQPADDQQAFLHAQVEILRQNPPKLVCQHGDPGSWNLLITPDDRVAFLDWENASFRALPLWDLLYFLRSLSVAAGHHKENLGNFDSFDHYFLQESPLSPLISDSVARYVAQIGLDPQSVQPLFYLCWVFWAVKQAALLEPKHLLSGFYWRSLQRCLTQPDAPTLRRLFSLHSD
jgi:aminoglycoside phosphotransferase (APT) family kinase protein